MAVINEWFNWIFDFIVSIIHVGYKGNAVGIWGWEYDKTHWTGKERAGWFKVCLLTHSFLYNWQKYSTGRKFSLDLNFTNSLMANLLNLNSALYCTYRNLSMKAYMIEIQKSKFANI